MVYGKMGLEDDSTIGVKFQPVPVCTYRERRLNPADSGKKCFPEWSGSASDLFRDSRISATKGINFFPVSKIFSTKRFPGIWSISLGSTGIKGNVLRGGVVLNMIIAETNIGKNVIEIIG